jgi:plastocyanin
VGSGRLHRLVARELAFEPERLQVASGDTVVWANLDLVPHTISAVDGQWDSEELRPGAEFRLPIDGSGTIHYVCRYHPTMTGVLVVQ